jgi:hypothetical protein
MHPVGARVKEIALMREYTGSRTRAFVPVHLAELDSAVRLKVIARALRQAADYKPNGVATPLSQEKRERMSYGWSRVM